jgi:cellulose synthase/poly-beta-1,6-N-acetylglucosamine synthase-like glycosyltransferase
MTVLDNTRDVVEKMIKKHKKIKLINNPVNLGNAARSQNVGLKHARGQIIAVVDGDSFPAKDSLMKMIGFFDDSKVGAVTCPVLARNTEKFLERLQQMEYQTISFSRKLLEYVDSIYVTPGPLALYRREAILGIGGFDENNLTQDIESTWHIARDGWERKMALSTYVTSEVPSKVKAWFVQRRRWNVGGLQCVQKYWRDFGKRGMLGLFIIPLFVIGLFWGLLGVIIFCYMFLSNAFSNLLATRYAIQTGVPIITMNQFYITPNFLNYLGIALFIFEFLFVLVILSILKDKVFRRENLLVLPFYLIVYLMVYPFIMIDGIIPFARGKRRWR